MRLLATARWAPACLLFAAVAGAIFAQDGGQENPQSTFKVQVRLVSLFINVTDQHGAPVPDLEKTNFALSEDNAPQTISVFEKQTNVPLSVALAVDTSGSTHKDLSVEQHAARDFAQTLLGGKTGHDQLSLFDFNSDVREATEFTDDLHQVDSGLHRMNRGPATALYQAVYLASDALKPRQGRKVLVLVSDGSNTVEGTTFDQALEEAQRGEVMIYSLIDVPVQADAGRDTAGEHAMITLSEETGGRYFYTRGGDLNEAFGRVVNDLRTQYLLGYYPRAGVKRDPLAGPSAGGFRQVRVVLRNMPPGANDTAHYRTGYYRAADAR